MIQLFKVRMSEKAPEEVGKVLLSGFIGQGSKVEEFETALQKELKTSQRPVTINSCTSAIDLALHLCGVQPGDEVIATPQTCFASQVGIIHRHARIRWADIDPVTGLMDPESARKLVNEKTKAIVAVNWAGKICDFKTLKSFGVPVIEDAAHTWDSFLEEKLERGDYICYSLQAIKFLTSADGGLLVCPNDEKTEEAKILRWYGLDRTKSESFRCTQNIKRTGHKYHMNDVNAMIGLCNIPEARESVLQQRRNAKFLIENVNNRNLIMPTYDETCSFWLLSMHVLSGRKAEFIKYLETNGIVSSPVHFRNDMYDSTIQFKEGDLPGVTSFDASQTCVPIGWWLSESDLHKIVDVLNRFN
jgi:dTDP-4-amino-4,6-dideoxygalactose transaminase